MSILLLTSYIPAYAVYSVVALVNEEAAFASESGLADSNLGKTISYALEQWPKACRFVDHVLLRPDTNLVENQIRPFVVGRKGWMFMDSPSGATASAAYYGLLATAQLNGHDPVLYLAYIFDQLASRPEGANVDDLLPYNLDTKVTKSIKTG